MARAAERSSPPDPGDSKGYMHQADSTIRAPKSTSTAYRPPRSAVGLKIAIVSPEVGRGAGVPSYWNALAGALAEDHEVHVFAAANRCDDARIRSHHVPSLRLGWLLTHLTFYAAARARFGLARLRSREQFDVVLGVGALTPYADIATVHFVQARELELQRNSAFPRERRLGGLAGLDYALYSRAMGWLGRRFYRKRSSRIVAISEAVKQDLVRFEGACAEDITVVPNGVDIQRFHPMNRALYRTTIRAELGLRDTDTAVLFVGNSWGRKGLRTAIEAIRGPEQEHIRLVVVGQGVRQDFLVDVPDDVVDRVVFTGPRSTDIERLYAAADVFLFPTLYEPFGLVVLEALASGLPTVVSASAGASEWLEDGVDAVLLRDPFDGLEARSALRSVTARPEFASSLAMNGRQKAAELQWSAVASALIAAAPVQTSAPALGRPA